MARIRTSRVQQRIKWLLMVVGVGAVALLLAAVSRSSAVQHFHFPGAGAAKKAAAQGDQPGNARPRAPVIGTYKIKLANGKEFARQMLDEPMPEGCYAEKNADYRGPALNWGLNFKLPSAAQCCKACTDFPVDKRGRYCNVWVYCGEPSGECWSPDIWNHTSGECWLKFQEEWDGNVDRSVTNLAISWRGSYPDDFREEHKAAPPMVQWTAGVIPHQEAKGR